MYGRPQRREEIREVCGGQKEEKERERERDALCVYMFSN